VILIGSGTELHIALEAQERLAGQGVAARVVSMPSWEIFEAQDADYKESILPSAVQARVSIEAGATVGWERYVGGKGIALGLDQYGASAPYQTLYEKFGLTAEKMAEAALSLI
jgi:transketolase